MGEVDERTPLSGSAPRSPRFFAKFVLGGVLAAALVLTIVLSPSPNPLKPDTSASGRDPVSFVKSSAAWTCGTTHYDAGYVKLANKKDDHYYYVLFESSSEPQRDPLVLWLTGGAGGSSMSALLTENGPCTINDDLTTKPNPFSWTQKANVIWLDQPTGVGFSYSNAPQDDADRDEQNVGQNIYWFLQGFLEKHPEFDGREFFITGESFAGHYIPATAHFIWQENQSEESKGRKQINLQGIAIGNGLVEVAIQYLHAVDMAVDNSYNISLLSDEQIAQMRVDSEQCVEYTLQCRQAPGQGTACADAVACFGTKLIGPYSNALHNVYDVRKNCGEPTAVGMFSVCGFDYSLVEKYLNQPAVREALNVEPSVANWTIIRNDVTAAFVGSGDWSFSYSPPVAKLLDAGVRVLIYAGDADLVCNWKGDLAWTLALDWRGREGFSAASERAFVARVPGDADAEPSVSVDAGLVRSFENLTFLRLFEAGHMVPADQPAVALDMINRFFRNEAL